MAAKHNGNNDAVEQRSPEASQPVDDATMMQPMTPEENIFHLFSSEESERRYMNIAARECTSLLIKEIDSLIDGSKSRLQVACSIGGLVREFRMVGIEDSASMRPMFSYITKRMEDANIQYREIDMTELWRAIYCCSAKKEPTLSDVASGIVRN
jgi:hypothetical protein